jgi:hypothetical protein
MERNNLIDKLRARWVTREMMRMQKIILEKKGLNADELERRREPILRMKREASDKEAKRQHIIETADDLFLDVVGCNFPQYDQKMLTVNKRQRDAVSEEAASMDDVTIGLSLHFYSIIKTRSDVCDSFYYENRMFYILRGI